MTSSILTRNIVKFVFLSCFLISCSKNNSAPEELTAVHSIKEHIDAGDLLLKIQEEGEKYLFNFENGDLQVEKEGIIDIVPDLDRWKTKVSFTDGTILDIPTKGNSLDYIIEKIQVDPSGLNPLAALVEVWLPTYGRVRVTVNGKNGKKGDITHLCNESTPRQNVPIFGLYPDFNNVVDLDFTDMNGKVRGSTRINIQTKSISMADFPKWKLVRSSHEKMEPGVNLVNYPGMSEIDVSIPYMIDNEGELRWVLFFKKSTDLQKISTSIGLKRTKQGTFIAGDQVQPRIVEIDMFGNLKQEWNLEKLGYKFHHEITESESGNFLITVTKTSARLRNGEPRINDFIIELDPKTGNLINEWDLVNLIDSSRYIKPDGVTPPEFSQSANNWAHNNSIGEIAGDLLATFRYQGIASYSRSGNLKWIISPHKYWSSKYKPFLLKPIAEDGTVITDPAIINGDSGSEGFDWSWGPHTPVALSEDRILVFDNGYNRNWIPNFAPGVRNYSRIVEYKIDLTKKTVQQIWSFGKQLGDQGFGQAVSGVQFLKETGNVLFCPGMLVSTSLGPGGRIVELNPETKEILYELEISANSGFAFHRVTRMPLYPDSY